MTKHPKIRLSRLRDIGWQHWDPIGLARNFEEGWKDHPAADEYDTYLLKAAGMVRRNEGDDVAAQYLVSVEREDMGLCAREDTLKRAQATVAAMRADKQLWNQPRRRE